MKRKAILVFLCFLLSLPFFTFAKKVSYKGRFRLPKALLKEIQNYPKEKLEYLASTYVALGERFFKIKYLRDSQACFMYAIQIYPIGSSAKKAKAKLEKYWKIKIP